tara:strand:- start:7 stop:303 length:297 start_codon:yes stop_codon:yes gene_type:complete
MASIAQHMSNYLRYLLTKQLGVTTNPERLEKRFVSRYFHLILKEGDDDKKKEDIIEPHHIKQLYAVMMARMLQDDTSVKNMYRYSTWSWFNQSQCISP